MHFFEKQECLRDVPVFFVESVYFIIIGKELDIPYQKIKS